MKSITCIITAILLTGCCIGEKPKVNVIKTVNTNCPKCPSTKLPKLSKLETFEIDYHILYPNIEANYSDEDIIVIKRDEYNKLINSSVSILKAFEACNKQSIEFNAKYFPEKKTKSIK